MPNDTIALEMHIPRKGPAEVLAPREVRLGPLAAGHVQVRVEAAGVAYADIVMRRGLYKDAPLPVTPGYDFVARVEACGSGVQGLHVGQRVAAITVTGSYASRRHVDARWVVPVPEGVEAAAIVAALLNGLTAWQMLHRIAHAEPGDWVLVHGAAGGVGSMLMDMALLAGLKVVGTASTSKGAMIAARGGVPVDYGKEDVVARVKTISDGGVVAAFDHIGGRHFSAVTMPSLRGGGVGVLYGAYDTTRDGRVNPLAIVDLMMRARFSAFGLFRQAQGVAGYAMPLWRSARPNVYRHDLQAVLDLLPTGRLQPLVGACFALADAAKAHHMLETRAVSGKVVLIP